MKKLILLPLLLISINVFSQSVKTKYFDWEYDNWYSFTNALSYYNYHDSFNRKLMFPDTLNTLWNENGTILSNKVQVHSIGVVFNPSSELLYYYGYPDIYRNDEYRIDSSASSKRGRGVIFDIDG